MKNDTFDKNNNLIVEFKPCEVAKEYDVTINMSDYTCPSPLLRYPPCDTDFCNNNFPLILIAILIIKYFNLDYDKN